MRIMTAVLTTLAIIAIGAMAAFLWVSEMAR